MHRFPPQQAQTPVRDSFSSLAPAATDSATPCNRLQGHMYLECHSRAVHCVLPMALVMPDTQQVLDS